MTAVFDVSELDLRITEGDDYRFTLTPKSGASGAFAIDWEIILDGELAAPKSAFSSLTGAVIVSASTT